MNNEQFVNTCKSGQELPDLFFLNGIQIKTSDVTTIENCHNCGCNISDINETYGYCNVCYKNVETCPVCKTKSIFKISGNWLCLECGMIENEFVFTNQSKISISEKGSWVVFESDNLYYFENAFEEDYVIYAVFRCKEDGTKILKIINDLIT